MGDNLMDRTPGMVSVCMATFNGEKYIRQQIDSILSQLALMDELIISDDGSTDSTLDIIRSYDDPRIKVLHHQRPSRSAKYYYPNICITKNYENALLHCQGEYIFLSDQDDIWEKCKVETMKKILSSNGGLVMSSLKVIRDDNSVKKVVNLQNCSFIKGLIVAKFLGSSMAMTKDFLRKVLPFPANIVSHDAWIALFAISQKQLTIVDIPLLLYRRHSQNTTSTLNRNSLYSKLKYRYYIFYNILRRSHIDHNKKKEYVLE